MMEPSQTELTDDFATTDTSASGGLVSYDDVLAPFPLMSTSGILYALDGFSITEDFSKLEPRESGASLRPLRALFMGALESKMLLVLTPTERTRYHFVLQTGAEVAKRSIRVHEDSIDVAGKALAEGRLPVIAARDLRNAALVAHERGRPLEVYLKYLQWRDNIPERWREAAHKVLETNATHKAPKAHALSEPLTALRAEQRKSVVGDFLGRCIWIDDRTEQLGFLAARRVWNSENDHFAFSPYPEGDAKMRSFGASLSRDSRGRLARRRGLARVISMVSSQLPWSSPTLHVCDEDFRTRHGLDRYYSIYRGLDALSAVAAPLLVYEEGTLDSAIPLDLVETTMSSEEYLFVSAPEIRERLRAAAPDADPGTGGRTWIGG